MFGWTRIFTLVAVAAAVAIVTGGAGAASTSTLAPGTVSHATPAGKVGTAASRSGTLLQTANLSTRAGVVRYLRAIGVDPRGLVIQRGARNYAGPNCPGAGWACTSTAHPVVQITAAGGRNTFFCTTGSCAVVQATRSGTATKTRSLTALALAPANKAACVKTTGLSQSCSISQTSTTASNKAIVIETTTKMSGLTQTASFTAQITQRTTGSGTMNTACLHQDAWIDGTTTAKKGTSVTVTLNAHQSASIIQDAMSGGNTVQDASPSTADCSANPLTQNQKLTSTATGSGPIIQYENQSGSTLPNVYLDIEQNQSTGFKGNASVSGVNKAVFSQTNALTAIAVTPNGAVNQTQSSASGGIQAIVNQWSHDDTHPSTISATQTETQCEHAQVSSTPSPSCDLTHPMTGPTQYSPTQIQFGPVSNVGSRSPTAASRSLAFVRKDPGSTQGDNPNDSFTIIQNSTQNNDTHVAQNQSNTVQGACTTSGNCTVTQTTTVDGQPPTTNTQSGKNVDTTTSCTGTICTKPAFNIVGNNAAFGGGPIQTYDFNTGALVNSFVPDGATIDSNNGRAVLVVGNEVFYTELCCGGFGATDFIRVAPFNGGAGGADIRTLPNPSSSSGVQDLAFAGGALYALTGYSAGPLQVFKLDPTSGAVLGGPVPIAGSGQEASADGFAILPNGNFLINLGDTSCIYNEYDSTTGAVIGTSLTVPQASLCTGVETDGASLYFQTDFNSFTQTDLAGNFIAKMTVQGNTVEDISLGG